MERCGDLCHEALRCPTNDAVRFVLADALLEAGDPRGELLSLQLGGAAHDDPRVLRLIKAHRRSWIGPDLDTTLTSVVFRRGFLDEAQLRANRVAPPEVWEAAARDERLGTVRSLRRGRGTVDHYLGFLQSECARDLREIDIPHPRIVEALAASPPRPFAALAFTSPPRRPMLARIAEVPTFDGVNQLRVPDGLDLAYLVRDLRNTSLAERVTTLEILVTGRPSGDGPLLGRLAWLRSELPGLQVLRLSRSGQAAVLHRNIDGPAGWVLTVGPGGDDWLTVPDQGETHWVRLRGGEIFGRLPSRPADVTQVRLVGVAESVVAAVVDAWGDVQQEPM
jgi:hypothetical protein